MNFTFFFINLCYLLIFIFYSFLKGFMMWTIVIKVFIEFVIILLMSYDFGFVALRHVGS